MIFPLKHWSTYHNDDSHNWLAYRHGVEDGAEGKAYSYTERKSSYTFGFGEESVYQLGFNEGCSARSQFIASPEANLLTETSRNPCVVVWFSYKYDEVGFKVRADVVPLPPKTVGDLINILKTLPQDAIITVDVPENGGFSHETDQVDVEYLPSSNTVHISQCEW